MDNQQEIKRVAPCPRCKGAVSILPSMGGWRGEVTMYMARCQSCGHTVDLASDNGRKESARREWNRYQL
jgi:C4-type Zn-finger protein